MSETQKSYKWYVATCKPNVVPIRNEPHIRCGFTSNSGEVNYHFEKRGQPTPVRFLTTPASP